jgi:hypothetical protein
MKRPLTRIQVNVIGQVARDGGCCSDTSDVEFKLCPRTRDISLAHLILSDKTLRVRAGETKSSSHAALRRVVCLAR